MEFERRKVVNVSEKEWDGYWKVKLKEEWYQNWLVRSLFGLFSFLVQLSFLEFARKD